ncbi:MAG: ATP-dependent DNA ligase [Thermoprotei archaeon]|jgi:DNA ligase-1
MNFEILVETFEKIERTTKRLEMTDLLVDLLRRVPGEIIDKVIYLVQGRLYPEYVGIELGMAEKMVERAISHASGLPLAEIESFYKKLGDLGEVAAQALSKRKAFALTSFLDIENQKKLTVKEVYETLDKIAKATGEGSQDLKIKLFAGLLNKASPREARYLARFIIGELRLGIADMTILDALAIAYGGSKDYRPILERAYNLTSNLGEVAKAVALKGIEAAKEFHITVGRPIRPMLAERLSTPLEILAKLGGTCAAEYKYDGERIQAHKKNSNVVLFSRKLENITHHYPDAVKTVSENIIANEAIVEAEAVAIDPDTGDMMPFQELMHRRRKYGVEEAMKRYPVTLFFFDALYVDGKDLTNEPYTVRREILSKIVKISERAKLSQQKIIKTPEDLEAFMNQAISEGCEGLMCKSLSNDSIYQAGSRGFLWIKLKRSYQSKMVEPVDLVIVGAFYGTGRRAGTYGALLVACYDPDNDVFKTVCKVGSGFTDEDLAKLPEMMKPYIIPHKHPRVESIMEADVWFVPAKVIEVIGDEITISPMHTAGSGKIRKGAGLAIRFPRFTGRYRDDKGPEDATTETELIEMYNNQLKKIEEVIGPGEQP